MARPRKFVEHDALLAARSQFWQRGYEGTSMSNLCQATGIASQSLYGAFGSKHDLFVRTLDAYCDEQIAGLEAGRKAAASPWQWLLSAVTFTDGKRLDLTNFGCYLSGSTAALSQQDKQVHKASQKTYERIVDIFSDTVTDAQKTGEIRSDISAQKIALALLAAMQGLEFIRKSGIDYAFNSAKESVVEGLNHAYTINHARTQ